MKKTILILTILAFIASGCKQTTKKLTEEDMNQTTDSVMVSNENYSDEADNDEEWNKKSLLFEETKDFMLNNKNHKITFKYYLNEFSDSDNKQTSLNVYVDDKEIYEINSCNLGLVSAESNDERENVFDKNAAKDEIIALIKKINPYRIKDNFTTITGDDGIEYIIFTIYDTADNNFHISHLFLNDNAEVLHQEWNALCSFAVFKDKITDVNYIRAGEKTPFYIKDNKFYCVEMECPMEYKDGELYPCKIYEKIITIKQKKVSEQKREIETIMLDLEGYCQ